MIMIVIEILGIITYKIYNNSQAHPPSAGAFSLPSANSICLITSALNILCIKNIYYIIQSKAHKLKI